MILDNDMKLSEGQAVTADAVSTNVLDRMKAGALGKDLFLVVRVAEAFTSGGAGTLQIGLQTDDDVAFGSLTSLLFSPVYALADLTVNKELFRVKLPKNLERYLRLNYDNGTAVFTAGKLDAFLVHDVEVRP